MISVILANYNGESFLHESLTSIINQNFDNYELLIIDDGSTDNSKNIINEFTLKYPERIRTIFQTENQGQGACFNLGVENSKGSLVCFIDSDDIWFPDKLSNVNRFFSLGYKNIAFLQHNLCLIRDNIVTGTNHTDILVAGNLYKITQKTKRLPNKFIATSGLTFPRKILEKILPIPKEFTICADGFLTRTALCYGNIASVSESWGGYRVHSGNSTFGNPQHDSFNYRNKLLIPALNKFYEANNFDLRILRSDYLKMRTIFTLITPPAIPMCINFVCRKYKEIFE